MHHDSRSPSTAGGAPRWEPIARMAIRLNRAEPTSPEVAEQAIDDAAWALAQACNGNDTLLREALAVFVGDAEQGRIGKRATRSLRRAIRLVEADRTPFRGIRLRARRRRPATEKIL